jgi:predicted dinucleotide-binding enzyme
MRSARRARLVALEWRAASDQHETRGITVTHDVVAIIGAGKVGASLGARLSAAGEVVRFGVRDVAKAAAKGVDALSVRDAVVGATVVLLTVPADAAVDTARGLGPLPAGTVVVDCTNPIRWAVGPVWNPPPAGSVTAAIAAALPGVAVVKGFNHFGAEIHADPRLAGGPADAFFAGEDVAAKKRIMALAGRIGFRAFDAGPLRNAAVLENLTVLWIQLSSTGVGRNFAFRIDERRA